MNKPLKTYNDLRVLYHEALAHEYEFIALVGADGMGKTYLSDQLKDMGSPVYHFDKEFFYQGTGKEKQYYYNLFFWDVWEQFRSSVAVAHPMVWDRTALCGAVYNGDLQLLEEYERRIKDARILHVLVDGMGIIGDVMDRRHPDWDSWDRSKYFDRAVLLTSRYEGYLHLTNLHWVKFINSYNTETLIKHTTAGNPDPATSRARMMKLYD